GRGVPARSLMRGSVSAGMKRQSGTLVADCLFALPGPAARARAGRSSVPAAGAARTASAVGVGPRERRSRGSGALERRERPRQVRAGARLELSREVIGAIDP